MNRKIIVTNKLRFLKRHLRDTKKGIFYLIIEEDNKSALIRDYLLSCPNTYEITSRDIIEEKKFVEKYSSLIKNLNIKNTSLRWWAMSFTDKNSLLTFLCKNVYDFLVIKKLIEIKSGHDIVVVISNLGLTHFISYWAKIKRIQVKIKVSPKPNLKYLLYSIPLFFIFLNFIKSISRMLASKLLFKPLGLHLLKDYIIITQFENNSFKKDGNFYPVYFGRLIGFLGRENKTFIICGFATCSLISLLRIRKNKQNGEVYPLEYFLTIIGLFKCLTKSIHSYLVRYSIKGSGYIDGENVLWLIKNEINNAFNTGQVFVNLSVYYAMKTLLKNIYTNKILYPFENRSWEKMILLAARETQKDIKLSGYQHASITPRHINFIIQKGEIPGIPFPDELVSMGKITKVLLEEFFGFPKDFVKVGCALRQEKKVFPKEKDYKRCSMGSKLFVALASCLDEYIRILKFLDKAALGSNHSIKIRPHPAIDFKKVSNMHGLDNLNYELDRNKNLQDSLKDSSIVLYASSTVGIEALSLGKPVIYIDLDNFLSSDPLFGFSEFKWMCRKSERLSAIINEINSLEEEDFRIRQEKGVSYAKNYFYPVNTDNIKSFL